MPNRMTAVAALQALCLTAVDVSKENTAQQTLCIYAAQIAGDLQLNQAVTKSFKL